VRASGKRRPGRWQLFRAEADKTRRDIDEEVAECCKKANVAEQEVAAAGQLKAEIEKSWFQPGTHAGLSAEFAGHEMPETSWLGA